jgi:predicted phage tail protein
MGSDARREILLYGHLRKRFGRRYQLAVSSPSEALSALCTMVPGFRDHMVEHSLPGYRVFVGDAPCDENTLRCPAGTSEVIKIVPVVAGGKDALGQILTGVALIALVYFTGGMAGAGFSLMGTSALSTATIGIGWSMAMGGVAQLLSPSPGVSPQSTNGEDGLPSYTFGSPTVTVGQGRPVPVLLGGPLQIGGNIVSAGITSEAYTPKGFGGMAPDDIGTQGGNGDTVPFMWSLQPQG